VEDAVDQAAFDAGGAERSPAAWKNATSCSGRHALGDDLHAAAADSDAPPRSRRTRSCSTRL